MQTSLMGETEVGIDGAQDTSTTKDSIRNERNGTAQAEDGERMDVD
jgi:hypothetical protein